MKRLMSVIWFLLISNNLYASESECNGIDISGTVVSCDGKFWPYKKDISITVVGYIPSKSENPDERNILISMRDEKKGILIGKTEYTIEQDPITELDHNSLKIDTARYQLTKNIRAIGIKFSSGARGPSCPDVSVTGDYLTLYIPEKRKLRDVLSIKLSSQRAFDGCIGAATGHDAGEYADLSISVMKTTTNGFYDLKISANISQYADYAEGYVRPDYVEHELKDRVESVIFRYNGGRYEGDHRPWWLGGEDPL